MSDNVEDKYIKYESDVKCDSIVFSVYYENYIQNIETDREDKVIGQWNILQERLDYLKYAYVFLVNSDKTIVKKYEIESIFPTTDDTRWDITTGKMCFKFKTSEDVYFVYPGPPVQAPHYGYASEFDAIETLSASEIDRRKLKSSQRKEKELTVSATSKRKTRTKKAKPQKPHKDIREGLVYNIQTHFSERELPKIDEVKIILDKCSNIKLDNVEESNEEIKLVLEEFYTMKDNQKK